MIRASALTKRYPRAPGPAVENVALDVAKGEALGLLGPNGAGKTTLLAMLAGALPPTAGDAEVAGARVAREAKAVRRRVGYAPQGGGLYPELTVAENVRFFARLAGVKDAKAATARSLARVDMTRLAPRRASALSGGERQRASLAAALAHDPPVLLLDEPGTGLDPAAREIVWRIARDAVDEGRALVVSTHDLTEVAEMCDRLAYMAGGRIVEEAPASEAERFRERYREAKGVRA